MRNCGESTFPKATNAATAAARGDEQTLAPPVARGEERPRPRRPPEPERGLDGRERSGSRPRGSGSRVVTVAS